MEYLAQYGDYYFAPTYVNVRALGHLLERLQMSRCCDYDGEPSMVVEGHRVTLGPNWWYDAAVDEAAFRARDERREQEGKEQRAGKEGGVGEGSPSARQSPSPLDTALS